MCSEATENRHRFNADIAHTLDRTGGLLPRIAALEVENEALTADLASWGERLGELEAENARLREALERIATKPPIPGDYEAMHPSGRWRLDAAREALEAGE